MLEAVRPNDMILVEIVSAATRKAIPVNLPLAWQLERLFCSRGRERETILLRDDQKDRISQECVATLVEAFPSGAGNKLLAALNEGSASLLRWLCSTLRDFIGQKEIPFDEWHDFASVMIEAAELDPATMLPQIAFFIRTYGSEYRESSDNEPGTPSSDYGFGFDEQAEQRLFPDQHETLKALFAKTETPDWLSPEAALSYEAVRSAYASDDT